MGRTNIEWCDFSVNPVKGICPVDCKDNRGKSYCYARRMYKRFKWNPEIREILPGFLFEELRVIKKPSRIFWGSTFELFHDSIPDLWRKDIFAMVGQFPQHTHIFLTKQPQNLIKWSPFPDNCWVGASVTDIDQLNNAIGALYTVKARVKFISFEPLLEQMPEKLSCGLVGAGISWVIIGQQTPASIKTAPKMSWIQEILVAAHNAGNIPVFMKDNLKPLLVGGWAGWKLRQEFPKC